MFIKIRKKYLQRSILKKYLLFPGLLTSVLSIGLWQVVIWQSLELLTSNLLLQTRYHLTKDNWDERIAIIAIDDRTLAKYGEFPISRDRYTQLLETLAASPPASFSLFLLTKYNTYLPIISSISTIVISAMTIQWQEQKEKQQLMTLFANHVSQETASLIWQKRDEILQNGQLEAQEMVATVLFSDIRSFTSISEGMTPRELLDWLNKYLGAMAECVQQHHGVVDKYIGDAVMAVFGIPFAHHKPEEIKQDAINAVAAAMAMQERLILLNQDLEKIGKPTIHIGIGIHTGLVVAGSIGGSQRLNYSVLGDAVNIAARLEKLNKDTKDKNPYSILISQYYCQNKSLDNFWQKRQK
jgi:class 3 adenylate cyclase